MCKQTNTVKNTKPLLLCTELVPKPVGVLNTHVWNQNRTKIPKLETFRTRLVRFKNCNWNVITVASVYFCKWCHTWHPPSYSYTTSDDGIIFLSYTVRGVTIKFADSFYNVMLTILRELTSAIKCFFTFHKLIWLFLVFYFFIFGLSSLLLFN